MQKGRLQLYFVKHYFFADELSAHLILRLLTQVVNIPTRNDKTLDLLFTNAPSPVNRVKGMPPIGKADHDIVYVEYDIKAKRIKQASRKIYLYKRADMVGLKDHMAQFKDAYLSEDHSHMSINEMWVKFKTGFVEAVERFIPSKMTKTKYSAPWIDATIKRLVKKRHKLYLRARKSKDSDVKIHYKRFRARVGVIKIVIVINCNLITFSKVIACNCN